MLNIVYEQQVTAGIIAGQYNRLTDAEKQVLHDLAEELYLAMMFTAQADKKWCSKLQEELVNDYIKGNNNYPEDLVKAYQLLSEYKNYQPKAMVTDASGVTFTQKGKKGKKSGMDDWNKDATC